MSTKLNETKNIGFDCLGLSEPLLKAIKKSGYTTPSPIQEKAIPIIMKGKDILASAQTGTGKTASFALPILEFLAKSAPNKPPAIKALILTPTRELAAQILDNINSYSRYLDISSTAVFGGVNIKPQKTKLAKGIDILVATPGRLLDLYNQKQVQFSSLDIFVLDEADRMLDMGFIHDIRKLLKLLPQNRQTLMFSATFSKEIKALATKITKNPAEVSTTPPNTTATSVSQSIYQVKKPDKAGLLAHLAIKESWSQVLIFTKTKHGANKLTRFLNSKNLSAEAIHGNKSQAARTKALENFKANKNKLLIATDIASRGLDINQLPLVVNYDLPFVAEDYVHRIGRTGRAGASGKAISLVCSEESKLLSSIQRLIKQTIEIKTCPKFDSESKLNNQKKTHTTFSSKNKSNSKTPTNNTNKKHKYKFKKKKNSSTLKHQ